MENLTKMGKRKTAQAGAPVDDAKEWTSINWNKARQHVRRLQVRIAKAVLEGRWNKVRSLQNLLTNSFYARLLAVKRVTSNRGKSTPGVDGILWKGARAKWRALISLRRRGYKPKPLRRIYIPKKNGKKRPLSIPTMTDRAIQAGFNALSKPNSATWILEADITGCFDNISQQWLMDNIPMDKTILRLWLKAGYVENGITYPSRKGTPQGGIISPTLANMTLDGLEDAVRSAVPRRNRVNFIRYADDFIITGKSKSLLEEKVKPAVMEFLGERGLSLSKEKTKLTHIKNGFTFLGQTFRKRGRKLHIKPSKEGVLTLIRKVGTIISKHVSAPMPALIKKLNQVLRGWANYHRHVVAGEAFSRIDTYVFKQLWRMVRRRHQNKSKGWLFKKYWTASGRKHIFAVVAKTRKDVVKVYQVVRISAIKIRRFVKIKAAANPYLPEFAKYFWERRNKKDSKLLPAMSAREFRAMVATR